jgi:hypothetical protein
LVLELVPAPARRGRPAPPRSCPGCRRPSPSLPKLTWTSRNAASARCRCFSAPCSGVSASFGLRAWSWPRAEAISTWAARSESAVLAKPGARLDHAPVRHALDQRLHLVVEAALDEARAWPGPRPPACPPRACRARS